MTWPCYIENRTIMRHVIMRLNCNSKIINLGDMTWQRYIEPHYSEVHNNEVELYNDLSRDVRKLIRFPTRSDTNWTVKSEKQARSLKLWI